jgi:hypothetical protein
MGAKSMPKTDLGSVSAAAIGFFMGEYPAVGYSYKVNAFSHKKKRHFRFKHLFYGDGARS